MNPCDLRRHTSKSLLNEYKPCLTLRSQLKSRLVAPNIRTNKCGERQHNGAAVNIWNGLRDDIQKSTSLELKKSPS